MENLVDHRLRCLESIQDHLQDSCSLIAHTEWVLVDRSRCTPAEYLALLVAAIRSAESQSRPDALSAGL